MSKMKYLWAAALVALCASLMSGAALAADAWDVTAQDLPAAIEWDQPAAASIEGTNKGTASEVWDSSYGLVAVEGPTSALVGVDRWGLTAVPVAGVTVAVDAAYVFDFTVTGPPLTTMLYSMPLSPTGAAAAGYLSCDWVLANPYTPSAMYVEAGNPGVARQETVVSRFPDDQPGSSGDWARFWIEECAGRVPLIVGGYTEPDGTKTYRPLGQVDRASMAVFLARAMQLPTAAYAGDFPDDVPDTQWAWPWIEALVDAGIVQGVTPTAYWPDSLVTREGMAVFVARGIWGGIDVPTGPLTPTFTDDVPLTNWAYDEIEYCVDQNVVRGVTPTSYFPLDVVTRSQMAVFVYKGFMMPTGTAVVLGGPAITATDPSTAPPYGWTSIESGAAADPGYAYVVFDAARIDLNLAVGGTWDVTFELVGPESPTPTAAVNMTTVDIQNAYDAVSTSLGVPYLVLSWDIPAALATGDYTLVVSVEVSDGSTHEVARQPAFTIE